MSRFAYHFRRLLIDLDGGRAHVLPLSESFLQQAIGGSGLGTRLLLETPSAELDPFARDSSLFFVFSPLVGSPLTTSAKFAVVSKSPLTNRINDSLAGSGFALAGKRTGFDAIEIRGKAPRPSIIVIRNDDVAIEPADHLWGLSIPDAESRIQSRYPSPLKIACIGPAGENRVLYATISHDGRHAGRGGSGAILGSKNIKAVVVGGDRHVEWANPEQLHRYAKQLSKKTFGPATAKYRELGTAANLLVFNRLQCLPSRNFRDDHIPEADAARLSPENLIRERSRVRASCAACTIGCEHLYELRAATKSAASHAGSKSSTGSDPMAGGPYPNQKNPISVRLEYESLFALGPLCGVSDPDHVLASARLCDEFGLDTISTGGTIAFAIECHEKGLLNERVNAAEIPELIRQIALRQGIGDLLAKGSRRAAEEIGQNSLDFAPQIKGLEIPGYDPGKLARMALGFAVQSRGADHNRSSAYEIDFAAKDRTHENNTTDDAISVLSESDIQRAIEIEDRAALMDSMIFCKFLRNVFPDFFGEAGEIVKMVCGWKFSDNQLKQIGSQIVEARKRFNVRAGWQPEEDRLPQRIYERSQQTGQGFPSEESLRSAIEIYNRKRGWTPDGFPPINSP